MAKSRIGPFALEAPMSSAKSSGQVFRGIHLEQRKLAALRIFPIPMGMTPESRQAYADQLEELKQLRHRGIVRCYGGGFDTRKAFLAYELIDGESLKSLLDRRERLPWETALEYSQQIAEALQYAHETGWIHSRLRPSKILISSSGIVKVADWRREAIASVINTPMSIEQLQFTAPEVFDRAPFDEKCDLYALGVVMYQMLTGAPPFTGTQSGEIIEQVRTAQVPSLRAEVLDCPVWLSAIVEQLLSKDPKQRPFSATALQLAFREAQRRQAEGVGVLQHATAGFSPLQLNVNRDEAEKVLGIKPRKKRKQRDLGAFFGSIGMLIFAFVVAVGAVVWLMLPLGEDALRSRSERLLTSEKWLDWNEARDGYLLEMIERFPDGTHSGWADEKIAWVNAREAERRMDRDERLGRKDDWTQAQIQYAEARRYERFGDLATALDKFRAIINLFGDRAEDQALVFLAQEGAARIQERGLGENPLQEFLQSKLDEAQEAYDQARISDARTKLESIIELYSGNQEVAPLVATASQRLDDMDTGK